jgi:hypothetical protein
MNSKIICNWLGITDWPPDHYAMLGLKPGEKDAASIEQKVHERMARLRCYQLSHPEEATEGMNRLAQAFISLTEALSKPRPAEKEVEKRVAIKPSKPSPSETQQLKASGKKTSVDWKNTPPPVRSSKASQVPVEATTPFPEMPLKLVTSEKPISEPVAQPIDPIIALAHESQEARRGLGTLPALIERINLTRKLILAWNQAGKFLNNCDRKLTRPAEESELTRRLNKIFELTAEYPKIVGHPGQPGYRVVAMARLEMTAQMFKMLDGNQRLDLARDWESGYRVLLSHRRYLRSQFKGLRRRGFLRLVLEAIRGVLNDHPVLVWTGVFLVVGLAAVWYGRRL